MGEEKEADSDEEARWTDVRILYIEISNLVFQFIHILTLMKNPRQVALAPRQNPEAKKARRLRQERRPSRHPPGPIGLATPFFRHLARPREAEMMEVA